MQNTANTEIVRMKTCDCCSNDSKENEFIVCPGCDYESCHECARGHIENINIYLEDNEEENNVGCIMDCGHNWWFAVVLLGYSPFGY